MSSDYITSSSPVSATDNTCLSAAPHDISMPRTPPSPFGIDKPKAGIVGDDVAWDSVPSDPFGPSLSRQGNIFQNNGTRQLRMNKSQNDISSIGSGRTLNQAQLQQRIKLMASNTITNAKENNLPILQFDLVNNNERQRKNLDTGNISDTRNAIAMKYLNDVKLDRPISSHSTTSQQSNFPAQILVLPDLPNASWSSIPSRYLRVSQLPIDAHAEKLYEVFTEFGDLNGFNSDKLASDGIVFVAYHDLRDAMKAQRGSRDTWLVQFCYPSSLITINGNLGAHTADDEGKILCIVTTSSRSPDKDAYFLHHLLGTFGDICKFQTFNSANIPSLVCEYFDIRDAADAMQTLHDQYTDGYHLSIKAYVSDHILWSKASLLVNMSQSNSATPSKRSRQPVAPNKMNLKSGGFLDVPRRGSAAAVPMHPSLLNGGGVLEKSEANGFIRDSLSQKRALSLPTNRLAPPNFDLALGNKPTFGIANSHSHPANFGIRNMTAAPAEQSLAGFELQQFNKARQINSNKNIVDLERILKGADTRTTIMIRNIPNKVDQCMLKDYIDETNTNEYDFLYLRIDFKNFCNVGMLRASDLIPRIRTDSLGYAFLNFVDPLSIISFVNARAGTKWNKFNSEKIMEVSYANIQGKEALVEKFRNSSVMDQDPSYRPRIYHTSGPLQGEEMEFPVANNLNRKMRSVSVATDNGLLPSKSLHDDVTGGFHF